jgi:hypothetical protein
MLLLPSKRDDQPTFAGRFTATPSASNHARLTSAIVKNTEANLPHGHAPDCDLYSANTSGIDALRWAVRDQHCTVVSHFSMKLRSYGQPSKRV